MLKSVNNIYKQKSHEIGNVVKNKCRWRFEILAIFSNPLRRNPPTAHTCESATPLVAAAQNFSHSHGTKNAKFWDVCAVFSVFPAISYPHQAAVVWSGYM
jgi:hypothetical protein